jgi:hypothetical protein
MHHGLISKIAREAKVERMVVYRALNGKSQNLKIIILASEMYLQAKIAKNQLSEKARKNIRKAESLK